MDSAGFIFDHDADRAEPIAEMRRNIQAHMTSASSLSIWFIEHMSDLRSLNKDDLSNAEWDKLIERADPACNSYLYPVHIRMIAFSINCTIIVITMRSGTPPLFEMVKVYHPDPNHEQIIVGLNPALGEASNQAGDLYSWDSFIIFWDSQTASFRDLCLIIAYDGEDHHYGTSRIA
jgi:hypothetical protein